MAGLKLKLRVLGCAGICVLAVAGCQAPRLTSTESDYSPRQEMPKPLWMGYDADFADAIQSRWLQLMDQRPVPLDNGHVLLEFVLHPDGTLDELGILQNTEGEILAALCAKAVLDPVPFKPWSDEMVRLFGSGRRFKVSFEFDALGVPFLSYTEEWTELARRGTPPACTFLVLNLSKEPARVPGRHGRRPWVRTPTPREDQFNPPQQLVAAPVRLHSLNLRIPNRSGV
jgi:hypothetical protein